MGLQLGWHQHLLESSLKPQYHGCTRTSSVRISWRWAPGIGIFFQLPGRCHHEAGFENHWCGECGCSDFLVRPCFLSPAILYIPNRQLFSYVASVFWHMIFSSRQPNGVFSKGTWKKSFPSPSLSSTQLEFELQWTSLFSSVHCPPWEKCG